MDNKHLYRVAFVLLFFISFGAFSQRQDYIAGRLFDAKTDEPVVFANVRIKDRAVGIITNVDGSFRIPLKYKEYGDIIEISSMGYETKEVAIGDFKEGELNVLTINPASISLQEAVVKGKGKRNLNTKQIVQRAIDAIPRNLPTNSFSTIGYYRDYQMKNDKYINLNEAILEVFDQGIDQFDDGTSETRLFHFELNNDFDQDSMARIAYDYETGKKIVEKASLDAVGGNEFRILRIHDAIRNYNVDSYDFIGTLENGLIKNHFFLRGSDTRVDDKELYTIKFWVFYPNYRANGTIYIEKFNFAIHKLEYTMYDEKQRNDNGKKNKHGHKQKVIFDITTDYRKIADKMYLNYISLNNSFQIRRPPKFVLDSTSLNAPGGFCMLYFNKLVDSTSAKKNKNYNVIFKNRKFKVEKVEVFQDSVKLRFESSFKKTLYLSRFEINTSIKKENPPEQLFNLRVKNIKDVDGNIINQLDIEDYQQFREFFVQRVKPDSRAPFDSPFMNKNKPIFENQPAIRPNNYDEFWMNTPLLENINYFNK